MNLIPVAAAVAAAGAAVWVGGKARKANAHRWLPSLVRGDWAGKRACAEDGSLKHLFFCVADHFEPATRGADADCARKRVEKWVQDYPALFEQFHDADGRTPRHTFFFPAEQYRPEYLERLGTLVKAGFGEVEVHLHHDRDTSENMRRTLLEFIARLRGHGHIGQDDSGNPRFGFIHGNWALDNSLPNGAWCGVNDELRLLNECGCYADFTLPSAPSPAQTRRINSIYRATDDPERPFSHDDGTEAKAGAPPTGDLLLIQGPLSIIWPGGKFGILPRLENGNLTSGAPLTRKRLNAWVKPHVSVAGRRDWIFVKVHTHGAVETAWPTLLGEQMRRLHAMLAHHYNDGARWALHYVTAREMYNLVRAAERGLSGQPGQYIDLEIAPPALAAKQ